MDTTQVTRKGNTLTLVDKIMVKSRTHFIVSCDICSKDTEVYKENFLTVKTSWDKGIIPCGCSGHYKYNEAQAIILATRRCTNKDKKFHGFAEEFTNISKTKVKGHCDIHNNTTWDNIFNYLKTDKECPDCSRRNIIFGVGINDTKGAIDGCPYFKIWYGMLKRCYHPPCWVRSPTYKGCEVHPDWWKFSKFKGWMKKQDWQGKQLDKDLLLQGNRVYSKDTCIFITHRINCFIKTNINPNKELPIGVTKTRSVGYESNCCGIYLGSFTDVEGAHLAWQKSKVNTAIDLLEGQEFRVQIKLQSIIDNINDDITSGRVTQWF